MWQVFLTPRARKDLATLEKETAHRIVAKLEKSCEKPEREFSRMVGCQYHKLRVGDYRVISVLDSKKQIIEVRRIGHRKNVYDSF